MPADQPSPPTTVIPYDEGMDARLVTRCLEGEVDAFGELMDRYQRPVFHGVLQMVRNREDARELTQQVFLKAYEHLASFDRTRRFFSWIYRIAVNEAITFTRARHSHEPIAEDLEPADLAPSAMDDLEARRRERELRRAIARLDPKYGAVITLFHLLQLPYEAVAEALELPEKTIKSRLFTARQLLREDLEGLGYEY